ncbi:hypothetical protein BGW37DRAFT_486892 [Umbelopsis sp. PMI_123]|nr:hypothetical protein BGW37DRAFT_486892 [Umbelopsis sp. PMI_123]
MKAYICVDYLSHDWDLDDLIFAHSQTRQQLCQTAALLSAPESLDNPREQQRLVGERSRLRRFENTLWRQISLRCTTTLGSTNTKINPVDINWQRDNDITWLYGPLYRKDDDDDNFEMRHAAADGLLTPSTQSSATGYSSPTISCLSPATSTSSSFDTLDEVASKLKPVLKRTTNTGLMTDWSLRHPNSNPARKDIQEPIKHQSWPREVVHFNPDVIEVQFLPESPIIQAFPDDGLWDSDDEDAEIYQKLISPSPSVMMSYWVDFWRSDKDDTVFDLSPNEGGTVDQPPESITELVLLLVQMLQSLMALCASWLLYQGISAGIAPIAWITKIKPQRQAAASKRSLPRSLNGI